MKLSGISTIFVLLVVFLATPPLEAHRIDIDARELPGGKILIEVFFGDGKPAAGAEIVVRRPDGTEVLRGKTDEKGSLEVPHPGGEGLKVEARHGAHAATADISVMETGEPEAKPPAARGRIPLEMLALGIGVIAAVAILARLLLGRRRAS